MTARSTFPRATLVLLPDLPSPADGGGQMGEVTMSRHNATGRGCNRSAATTCRRCCYPLQRHQSPFTFLTLMYGYVLQLV